MTHDRKTLKDELIKGLVAAADGRLPTSRIGRIGRTVFNVARGGRIIAADRKRRKRGDEPEVDMEKVVKMITSVGQLKGIAMKMGQILSYIDMAIPDEMRDALSVLQTHAQPMPFEVVSDVVREDLPERAGELLDGMERTPVSAASIGQVHRGRLPDGTEVAVKVQYPGIARAIEADFGPASSGTKLVSLIYPHARVDAFIAEAKARFLEECDYLHEAHCQHLFAGIYEGHPTLVVPAAHGDYCARRVLTTTFVEGLELDPFLVSDPSGETRDRIGAALFEFYLGSLFRHQIYNCDPHPGNYLFMKDGRVAMLDHGCTRQFEPRFVARLAGLTRAVHRDEREAVHRALLDLGIVREGKKYDYELFRGFLRSFYGPMLNDEKCVIDLSDRMEMGDVVRKKQQLARFSLPGEFLFLFRIRFGLQSVLARLGARANWYRLEKGFVDEFADSHPILMAP